MGFRCPSLAVAANIRNGSSGTLKGILEMSSIEEKKDDVRTIRTAAAISGIFFFHSTSSEDLRDWFDINTTENLWVNHRYFSTPTTTLERDTMTPKGKGKEGGYIKI
jgi:hypothetical protein